jgi:hypothetical protein
MDDKRQEATKDYELFSLILKYTIYFALVLTFTYNILNRHLQQFRKKGLKLLLHRCKIIVYGDV